MFFADCLRKARICPIFNADDKLSPCNYRPICILPTISKLLHRSVHNKMNESLDLHQIISPNQLGFCKGCSTGDAITHVLENISRNLNSKLSTLLLSLDLSIAFYTVSFDIIKAKLYNYSFRNTSYNFFPSYLQNRYHFNRHFQ